LVETLFAMTLCGMIVAAMLSTYLYLGRNLTRLSYRSALESQSRRILTTLGTDLRKSKSISNLSSTGLTLNQFDGTTIVYSYNGTTDLLTRNSGSGAVTVTTDIRSSTVSAPVIMPSFSFTYYTTDNTALGSSPTALSVKRIDAQFTLQAGSAVDAASGIQPQWQTASARFILRNRQLPDGT
jgi:hypothetical protein